MMDVNELEVEIEKEKKALVVLEKTYETEEDEKKCVKLEYKISRKEETIDKLVERQSTLLDREAVDSAKEEPKDKNEEEEDADVCGSCGSDLELVGVDENGTDIFECTGCGELWLDED